MLHVTLEEDQIRTKGDTVHISRGLTLTESPRGVCLSLKITKCCASFAFKDDISLDQPLE